MERISRRYGIRCNIMLGSILIPIPLSTMAMMEKSSHVVNRISGCTRQRSNRSETSVFPPCSNSKKGRPPAPQCQLFLFQQSDGPSAARPYIHPVSKGSYRISIAWEASEIHSPPFLRRSSLRPHHSRRAAFHTLFRDSHFAMQQKYSAAN